MKKLNKTPLAATLGVAFMASFAATAANAEANPFGMTELSSGYMQVAEAKAGEMKCGASMNMPGMTPSKMPEGACAGAAKPKTTVKTTEGSCGEAKCGAMMKDGKMKAGMEKVCGAMMKGKEGACGAAGSKMPDGKCGAQCGDGMKACPDKKTTEGACGAAMKGCGEGMVGCVDMIKGADGACGANMKAPATAPVAPAIPAAPAAPATK